MKKVLVSEWKLLYPLKKLLFVILEVGLTIIAIGAIVIKITGDFSLKGTAGQIFEYIIAIICIILLAALFKPTIKYLNPFYRCLQGFPKSVRKELVRSIDKEEFTQLDDLKVNDILYKKVWLSNNWFKINNHYIPRNGVAAMYLEVRHPGNHYYNHAFYLWVVLLNGEYFRTGKLFGLASDLDKGNIKGSYLTEHFFAQALQEHTSGLMIQSQRLSKKEPASEYSAFIKKTFNSNLEHTAAIITMDNKLQKAIVQELISKWRTESSRQEGFMLYSDFWKRDEWIRTYIKEHWWKPEN